MALSLFLTLPFALGYDASSPYTVTLNWIVPYDTTFTVALAGAETTIDFNPANKSSLEVEADSQSDGTPIITVTNAGNVNANYSALITADKPTWVTLKGYNSYVYGSAGEVGNVTAVTIEDEVAPAGTSESSLSRPASPGSRSTERRSPKSLPRSSIHCSLSWSSSSCVI